MSLPVLALNPISLLSAREIWVLSLGWEDPLKGKATHSRILAREFHGLCIVHGVAKSQTQLSELHFHYKQSKKKIIKSTFFKQ